MQKQDIDFLIENINFTVDDLLIINDLFMPLMKEERLFEFISETYKVYISDSILPFMKDLSFIKENPGILINLINWLNSYELLLTKKGFTIQEFQNLRSKIKELMPIFHQHISQIFQKYLDKIVANDDHLFKQN